MVTEELVRETIKEVLDPELGIDIVNLGMIYGVVISEDGKEVHVAMTLTTMGCPIFDDLKGQIEELVGRLEGVEKVDVELTFSPPWTPDFMSDEAKMLFKYLF